MERWQSWSNAPVLKTGEQKCSVGSNPTLSAIRKSITCSYIWLLLLSNGTALDDGVERHASSFSPTSAGAIGCGLRSGKTDAMPIWLNRYDITVICVSGARWERPSTVFYTGSNPVVGIICKHPDGVGETGLNALSGAYI